MGFKEFKEKYFLDYEKTGAYLKYFYRSTGVLTALGLKNIKFITPNHVTLISTALAFGAAWFFSQADYLAGVIAGILLQLSIITDYADGALARLRGVSSKFGAYLDFFTDDIKESVLYLAIAYGLWNVTQSQYVWYAATLLVLSTLLMRLNQKYTDQLIGSRAIIQEQKKGKFIKQLFFTQLSAYFVVTIGAFINQTEVAFYVLTGYAFFFYLASTAKYGLELLKADKKNRS